MIALSASHQRHAKAQPQPQPQPQPRHQHHHHGQSGGITKHPLRSPKNPLTTYRSSSHPSFTTPRDRHSLEAPVQPSPLTNPPSPHLHDPFARDTHGQGQADSIYARFTSGTRHDTATSTVGASHSTRSPRPLSAHRDEEAPDNRATVVISGEEDTLETELAPQSQSRPGRPYSRHSRLVSSSTLATGYLTSPASSCLDLDPPEAMELFPTADQSSPEKSTVDLPLTAPRPLPRKSAMGPSPLSDGTLATSRTPQSPEDGYETSSTIGPTLPRRATGQTSRRMGHAHDILQEMPEMAQDAHEALEARDKVSHMKTEHSLGVIAMGLGYTNAKNQSSVSVASRHKADKVLGLDPNAKLASFYLVSGLPRGYGDWTVADLEATRGLNPMQDSLGMFWRPDVLGNCFSGQKTEDYLQQISRQRKESAASHHSSISPMSLHTRGVHVPDAGHDGPMKILQKTLKFAHPRDVEVINSTLCPPSHCHSFTFSIPKHDTLAAVARTRLQSSLSGGNKNGNYQNLLQPEPDTDLDPSQSATYIDTAVDSKRNMSTSAELVFHGVTLTIYTPAEKDRSYYLKKLKERRERAQNGQMGDSLRSRPRTPVPQAGAQLRAQTDRPAQKGKSRAAMPWGVARKASVGEYSASETEGAMSDSDFEGVGVGRSSAVGSAGDEALVDDGGDVFWLPYAVTIVSRHPIYDFLQDYLRLTWARYSKNAKQHMVHIARILNLHTPRPGSTYRIDVTNGFDDKITVEATFPGGFNLGQGAVIPGVDFQIWPMFQALDLDVILTCIEVAMSNSGRVILYSKHSMMLGICVQSLYHILEMRNWKGLHMPILHARDVSLVVEDPGPYILGVPLECRYMVTIPSEVAIVDIDTNFLNSRARRDKARQRLATACGPGLPTDRSVPTEFKICFPNGAFANLNKMHVSGVRPAFLRGERIRAPAWWQHAEVMAAFDKVMLGKDKKPSFLERLTKSAASKYEVHLTPGEMSAKTQMRRRALHYVETRDQLEAKIAHINKKLAKLIQEGEHWKKQFEKFEAFADKLNSEANDLRSKIDREKREARRLSALATEKSEENSALQEQLKRVLNVHQETMIKLSDAGSALSEVRQQTQDMHDQFDYFDAQLDHALMAYGIGRYSRPPTPSEASVDSPQSRTMALKQVRPGTRDSQRSALSRHTVESSLSVLGAVHKAKARSKVLGSNAANGARADGIKEDKVNEEVGDGASKSVPSAYKRLGKSRPGTASTVGRGGEGGTGLGHDKADAIASRIASITAKLDLALHAVHAGSAASLAGDTSDSADDSSVHGLGLDGVDAKSTGTGRGGGDEDASDTETETETEGGVESDSKDGKSQASATPVASRRQSTASFSSAPPMPERPIPTPSTTELDRLPDAPGTQARPHLDVNVDADAESPTTARSPEYHPADELASTDDDKHQVEAPTNGHERKVSSTSSLGVIRPGVSLRIKPKKGSGKDSDAADLDRSESVIDAPTNGSDDDQGEQAHTKMSTHGSGISELLISPSPSDVSVTSVQSVQSGQSGQSGSSGAAGIKIRPKRRGEGLAKGEVSGPSAGNHDGRVRDMVREKEADTAQVKTKRWSGASAFGQV